MGFIMDVSFIILTWNSASYIKRCIQSYAVQLCQEGLTGEFIIVDNGSQDNTIHVIQHEIIADLSTGHTLEIISLERNYGTTISRNMGLKKATGKYIIICDSDTEFYQGKLRDAMDYLESNTDVLIVTPLLLWPEGDVQPSARKFPTLYAKLVKVFEIVFRMQIKHIDFYPDFPWDMPKCIQTAASAFWLMKRNVLDEVGYLDEKIFYSPEDLDYCFRVWKKGYSVHFFPNIKIFHHAQRLSRRNPFSRHALAHFRGLLYYFGKHKYLLRVPRNE